MHKGLALLSVAVFLTVGLAGCSSGDKTGFSVKAPSSPDGQYVFTANGKADNYTWDLGDRLTVMYGKTVRHAYDFKNGEITVTLTTKSGDKTTDASKPLKLGTGTNAQPTFILEGSHNWTVTGETMKFSAASSTDPDGDPLRYTWSCVRTGPAARQPTHVHPGFGGVPFATPPAGSVTALNAKGPLPTADRKLSGDLCQALGSGGKPSLDKTIEGSFTQTGVYDVYLLASDPVHPTTSGKYHFVVTDPAERPAENFTAVFAGNLTGGPGGLESFAESTGQVKDVDQATHAFSLPLSGKGGNITATSTNAFPDPLGGVTWILRRGTLEVARGTADGTPVPLPAGELKQSSYSLVVEGKGAQVVYSVKVDIHLDLDPFKVY